MRRQPEFYKSTNFCATTINGILVDQMKFFSRFEADCFTGSNADLGTSSGVAANSRLTRFHRKHSEATKLDPLTCNQGPLHAIEDGIDRGLCFGPGESRALNDSLN